MGLRELPLRVAHLEIEQGEVDVYESFGEVGPALALLPAQEHLREEHGPSVPRALLEARAEDKVLDLLDEHDLHYRVCLEDPPEMVARGGRQFAVGVAELVHHDLKKPRFQLRLLLEQICRRPQSLLLQEVQVVAREGLQGLHVPEVALLHAVLDVPQHEPTCAPRRARGARPVQLLVAEVHKGPVRQQETREQLAQGVEGLAHDMPTPLVPLHPTN